MHLAPAAIAASLLLVPIAAQDLIAVAWTGGIYTVNSYTGVNTQIGTGMAGQNALARDDFGLLWCGVTSGGGLARVDPSVPSVTIVHASLGLDLRGLANAGGPLLWGIRQAVPDQLILIDTFAGTFTTIGSTGFGSIQGLTSLGGVLYAWDLQQGLMTIDPATGAATDVNPAIAGFDMQWLSSRGDGTLIGGRGLVYTIDPATGVTTQVGGTAATDLRGAEAWQAATHPIGSGCNGTFGPVTLSGTLTAGPTVLTTQSTNHAASSLGLAVIGFSAPAPLLLDPFLGTQSCFLYMTLDVTFAGVTTAVGPATLDFAFGLPPVTAPFGFFVQHAVLEGVPGGLSTSNALAVQLGF